MRAKVRAIYSADIDVDSYMPEDSEVEAVWIRVVVGPDGGIGEESFDVFVCTPLWLRDAVAEDGPQTGRHRLIVDPFDMNEVQDFLTRQFESIEASDWQSLGIKLAKFGHWEFEDYVP